MKNIKTAVILILFASLCTTVMAEQQSFIVRNDKKRLLVKSISASEDGVLTYKTQNFSQKLKPGQYLFARGPMSNELKDAVHKYRSKDYKHAVVGFDKAYKTGRYLGWGSLCMYYAAKSLEALHKKDEALKRLQQLKDIPLDKEEVSWFLKAKQMEADMLIADKKFDDAANVLSVISRTGDTKSAMFANNARADILVAQGKSSEALFIYMRNIILFNPDKSKESLKSISKVVEILKAQNNPRAADFEKMMQ